MERSTASTVATTKTNLSSRSVCSISTASRLGQGRSKDQVRSRLLNNLGIFNGPGAVDSAPNPAIARKINILRAMGLGGVIPPRPSQKPSLCSSEDMRKTRPKLTSSNITIEPLSGQDDGNMERRKICFDDSVSVVPIPMRSEYSERVRTRLWSNRYEIHENASRNAIEFAAEGWDWRSVTEDEGMFVCTASGELIHPVHCQQ
jgi:hypothetical protein